MCASAVMSNLSTILRDLSTAHAEMELMLSQLRGAVDCDTHLSQASQDSASVVLATLALRSLQNSLSCLREGGSHAIAGTALNPGTVNNMQQRLNTIEKNLKNRPTSSASNSTGAADAAIHRRLLDRVSRECMTLLAESMRHAVEAAVVVPNKAVAPTQQRASTTSAITNPTQANQSRAQQSTEKDASASVGPAPIDAGSSIVERLSVVRVKRSKEEQMVRMAAIENIHSLRDMMRTFGREDYGILDFEESVVIVQAAQTGWVARIYAILPSQNHVDGTSDQRRLVAESTTPTKARAILEAQLRSVQLLFPAELKHYATLNRPDYVSITSSNGGAFSKSSDALDTAVPAQTVLAQSKCFMETALAMLERESKGRWSHLTWRAERCADRSDPTKYCYTAHVLEKNHMKGVVVSECRPAQGRPLLCAIYTALMDAARQLGGEVAEAMDVLWSALEELVPPTITVRRMLATFLFDHFFGTVTPEAHSLVEIVSNERQSWLCTAQLTIITDYRNPSTQHSTVVLCAVSGTGKRTAISQALDWATKENFLATVMSLSRRETEHAKLAMYNDITGAKCALNCDWGLHRKEWVIAEKEPEILSMLDANLQTNFQGRLRVRYKGEAAIGNTSNPFSYSALIFDAQDEKEPLFVVAKKGRTPADALSKAAAKALLVVNDLPVPPSLR